MVATRCSSNIQCHGYLGHLETVFRRNTKHLLLR